MSTTSHKRLFGVQMAAEYLSIGRSKLFAMAKGQYVPCFLRRDRRLFSSNDLKKHEEGRGSCELNCLSDLFFLWVLNMNPVIGGM